MVNLLHITDPCPCGSGRQIAECCLTARYNTTPAQPKTGYSNPRCYARSLQDCVQTDSQEHYISESILAQINSNWPVLVSGFPWLSPDTSKMIPTPALTAGVLCRRHNGYLSCLDRLAGDFFGFLSEQKSSKQLMLMNGYEFERWVLKLLCGLVSSGNLTFNSEQFHKWCPPDEWLQILFGIKNTFVASGLHIIVPRHNIIHNGLAIKAARNPESGFIELAIMIEGIPFLFSMQSQLVSSPPQDINVELYRRPQAIQIKSVQGVREVHFGWLGGKTIIVERQKYDSI